MRMRRRNNLAPRMAACEPVWIHEPETLRGNWRSLMPGCRELPGGGRLRKREVHGRDGRSRARCFADCHREGAGRTGSGVESAMKMGLKNVFFVSLDADRIDEFFADDEIDLLYINFCDPWPRKKNAKRRLTYHTFLEKYKKVLKLGGQIHFKTDNAKLFEWSLPEMESCYLELHNLTRDLHANGPVGIMTGYEEKFYALGTPINRVEAVVVTKTPRPADVKDESEDNDIPTDDGKEQES